MNVKQFLWCMLCDRCFEVALTYDYDLKEGWTSGQTMYELELQLGVAVKGGNAPYNVVASESVKQGMPPGVLNPDADSGEQVYALCPYEDCKATPANFLSWNSFRKYHPDAPEVPTDGKAYPQKNPIHSD